MIYDAYGKPVKVEPIPQRPPESDWDRNERMWLSRWLELLAKPTPRIVVVP